MIENQMVLHNRYGIRDPQEEEPVPFRDVWYYVKKIDKSNRDILFVKQR